MSSSAHTTPIASPSPSPSPVKVVAKKPTKKVAKKVAESKDKVSAKGKTVSKAEKEEKEEKEVPVKKARAPTLAAKYNKYMQFSFYMIRAMNAKCLENNEDVLLDEEKFFEAAHVFDTVGNQQEFVNEFLENKGIAKEMRGHLADKKKAEKVAEKEAIKAAKVAEKLAEKEAAKAVKLAEKEKEKASKPKKASKKATKGKSTNDADLVTSLVTLATNPLTPGQEPLEAEEELDVRVFNFEDKEYLIDDSNNLYDSKTHTIIGSFDVANNAIISV